MSVDCASVLKTNNVPDMFKLEKTTFKNIRIKVIYLRLRQTETLAERVERATSCGAQSAKERKLIIPGKRQVSKSETSSMSHNSNW